MTYWSKDYYVQKQCTGCGITFQATRCQFRCAECAKKAVVASSKRGWEKRKRKMAQRRAA